MRRTSSPPTSSSWARHHLTLTVFADTVPALDRVVAQARSDLADSGAVVAREDLGLEAAYWAQLPGNARLRTRPGVISSRNWAGMCPLHGYPKGQEARLLGQARSQCSAPRAARRICSTSTSRTSATSRCSARPDRARRRCCCSCWHKPRNSASPSVFFDKDRGGEILSRALGGTYLVLPSGQPTGMAPLRALSDTPQDREFLIGWVTHLIRAGGYKCAAR